MEVFFFAPRFAAVFFVDELFAARLFDLELLLLVDLAAAAMPPFLRDAVFKSPSMKVPTFFFSVILGASTPIGELTLAMTS